MIQQVPFHEHLLDDKHYHYHARSGVVYYHMTHRIYSHLRRAHKSSRSRSNCDADNIIENGLCNELSIMERTHYFLVPKAWYEIPPYICLSLVTIGQYTCLRSRRTAKTTSCGTPSTPSKFFKMISMAEK